MRFSFAILFSLAPALAFAVQPIELTRDDFKMFRQWQNAMQDPRVEKIAPAKRNAAIAKDAGFKLKEMEAAIEKGEAAGDLKATCAANLKESLEGAMAGRIGTIDVDTSEPHAVAYVQWMNENVQQLEEEASVVAAYAARACPIVSTITLWAQDQTNPKARVFQALISGTAASRINVDRAKDFADTRYIRLFEDVKNIAHGDVLDAATGTAVMKQ
ncbi:MAG: hypothetical protein WBV82_22340 [Myxococcaceae bacterium]